MQTKSQTHIVVAVKCAILCNIAKLELTCNNAKYLNITFLIVLLVILGATFRYVTGVNCGISVTLLATAASTYRM